MNTEILEAADGTKFVQGGVDEAVKGAVITVCRQAILPPPKEWFSIHPTCKCGEDMCRDNIACGMTMERWVDRDGRVTKWGNVAFLASPNLQKTFTTSQLWAIICHEVGHYRNGDLRAINENTTREEYHRSEFKADEFAAEMGLGLGMIEALQRLLKFQGFDSPSKTHPSLQSRIDRLYYQLGRGELKAA